MKLGYLFHEHEIDDPNDCFAVENARSILEDRWDCPTCGEVVPNNVRMLVLLQKYGKGSPDKTKLLDRELNILGKRLASITDGEALLIGHILSQALLDLPDSSLRLRLFNHPVFYTFMDKVAPIIANKGCITTQDRAAVSTWITSFRKAFYGE